MARERGVAPVTSVDPADPTVLETKRSRVDRTARVQAMERLRPEVKPHRVAMACSHTARPRQAVHLRPLGLRAGDPDQRAVPCNAHAPDLDETVGSRRTVAP